MAHDRAASGPSGRRARSLAAWDEAGRGPLAAGGGGLRRQPPEPLLPDINDSKKVAEKKREALCEEILRCAVSVGVGVASVEEIETLNIKQARAPLP